MEIKETTETTETMKQWKQQKEKKKGTMDKAQNNKAKKRKGNAKDY